MITDVITIRGKEFVVIYDGQVSHPQQEGRLLAFKNATDNKMVWTHKNFHKIRGN